MSHKTKLVILVELMLILSTTGFVHAQTPSKKISSPSATPKIATPGSVIDKLKQIEKLKEKIATKVAELREKDRGVIMGTVKKIEKSSIIITSRKGERQISFSEDTVFYTFSENEKTETSIKKIKEGNLIAAFGYFSDDRNLFSAKYLYLQTPPIHIIGKIANVDRGNYTITIKDKGGNTIVDIETYTSSYLYNKEKMTVAKIGFSKFKIGDSVHLFGTPNPKEENRVSAKKIYVFSFSNQTMISPTPTTITPTKTPTVTKKTSSPSATISKKKE